jgi:hypothetical protein
MSHWSLGLGVTPSFLFQHISLLLPVLSRQKFLLETRELKTEIGSNHLLTLALVL